MAGSQRLVAVPLFLFGVIGFRAPTPLYDQRVPSTALAALLLAAGGGLLHVSSLRQVERSKKTEDGFRKIHEEQAWCYSQTKLVECLQWGLRHEEDTGCRGYAKGFPKGPTDCDDCKTSLTKSYASCDLDECIAMCEELYEDKVDSILRCSRGCEYYKHEYYNHELGLEWKFPDVGYTCSQACSSIGGVASTTSMSTTSTTVAGAPPSRRLCSCEMVQGIFVTGEVETNWCSHGSSKVTTWDECEDASEAKRLSGALGPDSGPFKWESDIMPTGCFVYFGKTYFNPGDTGKGAPFARPICFKDTTSGDGAFWTLAKKRRWSCDTACAVAGGTCDAGAMLKKYSEVDSEDEMKEVMDKFGTSCTLFDHSFGSNPDTPGYRGRQSKCYVSTSDRDPSSVTCSARSDRARRLCSCQPEPSKCYNEASLEACLASGEFSKEDNGCIAYAKGFTRKRSIVQQSCQDCKSLTRSYAPCDEGECEALCKELYREPQVYANSTERCINGCKTYKTSFEKATL